MTNFVPELLRAQPSWLVWKLVQIPGEAKPRKIPYYANGKVRRANAPDDRAHLVHYEEAARVAHQWSGVGFACFADTGVTAVDFDDCVNERGEVDPRVLALVAGTYAEISPSGRGVRAFFLGTLPSRKDNDPKDSRVPEAEWFAVEFFGTSGYVTVTGNATEETELFGYGVEPLTPAITALYAQRFGPIATGDDDTSWMRSVAPKQGLTLEEAREMVLELDPACGYGEWLAVAQALHHEFDGAPEAYDLFVEWSEKADKPATRRVMEQKWRSFGNYSGPPRTMASLVRKHEAAAKLETIAEESESDVRLSRMLADQMHGRYLFEAGGRGWMKYREGAYRQCRSGEEQEEAKRLGATILGQHDGTSEGIKKAMKLAARAMSAGGVAAALKLAQSDPKLTILPEAFDDDPDLLNVRNGVVHLPTSELRPHDPALRMARQCAVEYSPGNAPHWRKFLRDISLDDDDWIDYLQRLLGYVLCGRVAEEKVFFLIGVGANGKSVLANVMRRILGDYVRITDTNFLMESRREADAASPSLAMLAGSRLALANEIPSSSRLSSKALKDAGSTEAITARMLHGNPFTFVPTHKLLVRGNHRPNVYETDEGTWRRIELIPFDFKLKAEDRDLMLEEKLMKEAPAILAWMVAGYREYMRRRLTPARRVAAASLEYRADSDLLGKWIAEECDAGSDYCIRQENAYTSYRLWCHDQGLSRPMSKKAFTQALMERGIKSAQESSGSRARVYVGLRLHVHQSDQRDGVAAEDIFA